MYELFLFIVFCFFISEIFPAVISFSIFVICWIYKQWRWKLFNEKGIVVIYHVEDQAVWIDSIMLFPYTHDGLKRANDKVGNHKGIALSAYAYVLPMEKAEELHTKLNNMNTEYEVYEYIRLHDNEEYLDEVVIK